MAKEKRKVVYKWLREQAKILPQTIYRAYPKMWIIKDGRVVNVLEKEEEYNVNHYRRMKRLYNRFGLEGVNLYFLYFGYMLKNRERGRISS